MTYKPLGVHELSFFIDAFCSMERVSNGWVGRQVSECSAQWEFQKYWFWLLSFTGFETIDHMK